MRPPSSGSDGERTRREVLGDEHVDRAQDRTTDFTRPFQDFLTRYAWGDVWARPGLDRRTRSAVTLAVLTALHCRGEIGMHVAAARRNGLTEEEIGEVLLHTAVYAGLPAANEAFAIARDAIASTESADDSQVGENVCPGCGGRGRVDAATCPDCGGSGTVTEVVGDA